MDKGIFCIEKCNFLLFDMVIYFVVDGGVKEEICRWVCNVLM